MVSVSRRRATSIGSCGTRRPGDRLAVGFERRGVALQSTVVLAEDPNVELVSLESTGGTLSPDQAAFREAWLGSQQ